MISVDAGGREALVATFAIGHDFGEAGSDADQVQAVRICCALFDGVLYPLPQQWVLLKPGRWSALGHGSILRVIVIGGERLEADDHVCEFSVIRDVIPALQSGKRTSQKLKYP